MDLRDRVVVVTGASSGIGRAAALALARRGARLALAARTISTLEALSAELRPLGVEHYYESIDVSQQDQVQRFVEHVLERWGRVDILICSAGQYIRSPFTHLTIEQLERSMAVNFYGSVFPVLAVLPQMRSQRGGHIVVVSSMDAKKGLPPDAPYAAAKFAISGFSEVLRQELHGTGVRVTTVFPGRVDTPMIENLKVPWISAKISPDAVARAILRALENGQPEVILPAQARLLYYLNVVSPRLADLAVHFFHLQGEEVSTPSQSDSSLAAEVERDTPSNGK